MIDQQPEEPGKKYALTFTIAVHLGLVLALFLGVQWKRSPPEVMEVELWSARPMPALQAPPPPPPEPEVKPEPKPLPKVEPKPEPPPPKKPDIAVKEEKKKPEPKKPEPKPEPPKPEPPKKPEPKPEPKKPEPKKPEVPKFDFDKELARETSQLKSATRSATDSQRMNNAAAAEAEQRASSNKRGLDQYAAKIRGKVRGNIILPLNVQGNPEAIFAVIQLPSGEVLDVRLKRSSGNSLLDSAIESAIRRSSPLPKPDDPALYRRDLEIRYKPFEE